MSLELPTTFPRTAADIGNLDTSGGELSEDGTMLVGGPDVAGSTGRADKGGIDDERSPEDELDLDDSCFASELVAETSWITSSRFICRVTSARCLSTVASSS